MSDPLRKIDVSKLKPAFIAKVKAMLDAAATHGIVLEARSGFRNRALQALLYKKFLAGGPRAAPPGKSKHEVGEAIDFLAIRDGKPVEDGADPVYEELETICARYGLKTLRHLNDAGHVELA